MDFTPRRVVRVESSRSVWQSRMQSRLRRAETRVLRALLTSSAITTPRSTYGWFVRYESTHDGACEPAHDITRGPAHDIVAPPAHDRSCGPPPARHDGSPVGNFPRKVLCTSKS